MLEQRRLVSAPNVWKRYGIHVTTGHRWMSDARLGFPKPVKIRGRNYFSSDELDEFDHRMAAAGRRAVVLGNEAAAE